jgi:hypothetical protein
VLSDLVRASTCWCAASAAQAPIGQHLRLAPALACFQELTQLEKARSLACRPVRAAFSLAGQSPACWHLCITSAAQNTTVATTSTTANIT